MDKKKDELESVVSNSSVLLARERSLSQDKINSALKEASAATDAATRAKQATKETKAKIQQGVKVAT